MAAPQAYQEIAQRIQDKLIGQGDSAAGVIKAIQDTLGAPGKDGAGGLCQDIATSIIAPIIVAELTFVGIRIALKSPFADQFAQFTRTLFIAYILIVSQMPQAVIRGAMTKMTEGGKQMGKELIEADGKQAADEDPIKYWGEWLGDINTDKEKCKYHKDFIMRMFKEDKIQDYPPDHPLMRKYRDYFMRGGDDGSGWGDQLKAIIKSMAGGGGSPEGSIFTNLKSAVTVETFLAVLMPFMILSMLLTMVMVQMAGYMAPVFTQVAILAGSRCVLEFTLAAGLCVMPLMFFNTFKNIWVGYLTFCGGIAMIPCFYYIMSAIGFAFSTLSFDAIFPEVADDGGGGVGLAVLFKILFKVGLYDNIPALIGILGDAFTSFGLPIFLWFVAIFEKLFFLVGGTVIVTTFVSGGVGFAALAPGVASSWNKAFENAQMMEKISEFFTGVQGAVGSAVGQAYGQAVSSGSNLVGGIGRGLFGR